MEVGKQSVINNKRVLKNTIFLYARMLLMMLISLFTVRLVLRELGVVDYGIYNVVGSIVALCSFLTGSLTAASNRFFAKEMVDGTNESLNNCFCLNFTTFGLLMLVAVVFLETIGLWYVNNKMVIPQDRMVAANVIYQLSIVVLCVSFISIPYNALIIIHEDMPVYAYASVVEAVARLLIVFVLVYSPIDKLILYGILMALISFLLTIFYIFYCRLNYPESKFRPYWNRSEFKELFSFISWYFFGSISYVVKSQGINLVINAFFSPAINAARAIAFQVEGALKKFSDGFFTASKPQIYKAYSNGEYEGLNSLIVRTTIICVFLMSIFSIPISFNSDFVLSIWLGQVPDKASIFLQLVIVDSLLNISSEPVILTILATGKQKAYQILEFTLRTVTLPCAYLFLHLGFEAESTVTICIIFSALSVITRMYMLKRCFPEYKLRQYFFLLCKLLIITVVVSISVYLLKILSFSNVTYLILSTLLSTTLLIPLYYWGALTSEDKVYVKQIVKNFLRR